MIRLTATIYTPFSRTSPSFPPYLFLFSPIGGHISIFQIQLIQSWFSFWVFILEVPTGAVADKIGRKHSIALGSAVVAIAIIIYGSFANFYSFLLAEFIFAIGYALCSGADQALLYDTLKEQGREGESKKILGRADSFHMLGMLLAAPFGSLIAAKFGLNAPQLASSIPFFLAAAIGYSIREPRIRSDQETPKYIDIVKKGFRTIKENKVVRTLAIDSVLVSAASYFVVWFNQPILKSIGIPIIYFGLAHSFLLLTEIFVSSNFQFMEKILGSGKKYLKTSALLVVLGFFLVALFPNLWTVLLFIALVGGIGYTRGTYIVSIANKYIDSRERATVLSTIGMFRRFGLIIMNPFIGYMADRSMSLALILIGLLPLGTLFIKEEID